MSSVYTVTVLHKRQRFSQLFIAFLFHSQLNALETERMNYFIWSCLCVILCFHRNYKSNILVINVTRGENA